MTKAELKEEIKKVAEKHGIAQYEAAQLVYLKRSKAESEAKKDKESLKAIIKDEYERQEKRAHAVLIPDTDQYATGYFYSQKQPKWDDELAHKIVPAELLAQFHKHEDIECFTVKAMGEGAAQTRVEEANTTGVTDTTGSKGSKE